jgi:hypothetical protein
VVDDPVTDCEGTKHDNESEQTSHGDPRRSSFTVVLDAVWIDGRLSSSSRNSNPTTYLHMRMIGRTAVVSCSGMTGIWVLVFVAGVLAVAALHYKFSPGLGEVAKLAALGIPLLYEMTMGFGLAYRYLVQNPTQWIGVGITLVLGLVGPITATVVWRKRRNREAESIPRFRHAELVGLTVAVPLALVLTAWIGTAAGS